MGDAVSGWAILGDSGGSSGAKGTFCPCSGFRRASLCGNSRSSTVKDVPIPGRNVQAIPAPNGVASPSDRPVLDFPYRGSSAPAE